ncbi:MAG: DUF2274 domain-containing protein [Nitratireductor sp.]
MDRLRLSAISQEKPVKVTIELPGAVYRDLVAYAELLSEGSANVISAPSKLILPMVERFMATDRAFARSRKSRRSAGPENRQ